MQNNKKRVKGFTLIELIVVMAIFSIIMFGALQLVRPVMKMMIQADVHEGGNAAVSSISGYLENELSTAEYIMARNALPPMTGEGTTSFALADTTIVENFVLNYYEGVLKAGSTPDVPSYGTGKVHVVTIDNTQNGKISSFEYDVKFDLGNPSPVLVSAQEYAVNKAYYDNYTFEIKSGLYDNNTFDPTQPDTYEDLISNLSTKETVFSIRATTNRSGTEYSFVTNATMSLINIFKRGGGGVTGSYFVVNESFDPTTRTVMNEIVDITTPNLSRQGAGVDTNTGLPYVFDESRQKGGVTRGSMVEYVDGSTDGYCFIYSHGAEIDTQ